MTTAIQYATTSTSIPRPLWHRVVVIPVYFLGWMIGCGVAGAYATAITVSRLDADWLEGGAILWSGGGLCGIGGAALAHLLRRRRWPQVIATGLGAVATALAGWAVYDMLRGPRGMFWNLFYTIALIMLSGAVAALCGGIAGIVLTRRR